ncbi:holo-ACP synthase [Streptomyces sp. NPDC057638]|uniref:holo-ACP synthase n=1 Tax=Streptomyces sp. NPDC057638 TaxID=3346190 RepID=UPI00367AC386
MRPDPDSVSAAVKGGGVAGSAGVSPIPVPPPRILVGTDLVAVDRIARLLAEQPGLAARVFTGRELAYCQSRGRSAPAHLAARFAAKEAVLKALGTGAAGADWTDIEVVNGRDGRPGLRLRGRAASTARRERTHNAEISLTHTAGLAMAHAVLLCAG